MSLNIAAMLASAGHDPALEAVVIVLATFILEDAATMFAAMRAQAGDIPIAVALGALYVGVILGDLGLYGVGRLAAATPWLARHLPPRLARQGTEWLDGRVFSVVLISRFIPGARLPTYTACGYLRGNFRHFALAATVATSIWTSMLFAISFALGAVLTPYLLGWRWAVPIGFTAIILLGGRAASRLREAK
jgi:membrane protein DedA with SNARE-associated domain